MAQLTRRKKIIIATAVIIILIAFVVIPAYIAYASVHPPRCDSTLTPADYGLNYTTVQLNTTDGITLRGWIIQPKTTEKQPVIIVMHGYTSCKAADYILEISTALAKKGYRIVLFDFRAHGESGGSKTTIGPKESTIDAPTIINYTATQYPDRPIILLGYSMGAVVAIIAGNNNPHVTAIIADSPYPLLNQVVPRWLKSTAGIPEWYSAIIGFWGKIETGENLDFGPLKLDKINKPLLVIAGTKDPLITPQEAKTIANLSTNGKAIIVQGAEHVESYDILGIDKYTQLIQDFITNTTLQTQLTIITHQHPYSKPTHTE